VDRGRRSANISEEHRSGEPDRYHSSVATDPSELGANSWLIDDMYQQFRENPSAVSAEWQQYFASLGSPTVIDAAPHIAEPPAAAPTELVEAAPPAPQAAVPAPTPTPTPTPRAAPTPVPAQPAAPAPVVELPSGVTSKPMRGVSARIVENMELSLGVPTATSYRQVPARLLEVNRSVINGYLGRTRQGKVSFTHLIGYALVRALSEIPALSNTFDLDEAGKPVVLIHDDIGLGLAVDIKKKDGSRSLLVPCIKGANHLDFKGFWKSYEEVIAKVRGNKLTVDDFAGVTITLTNVGTIGTLQSVPRLMPGQSAIVGVGAIGFPAEFAGADPDKLAEMGISKVITISNTYDHRVVQGAESGQFLARMHQLLLGEDEFYDEMFASLNVPYEPVRWRRDHNPVDREASYLQKQMQVRKIVQMYRVRGHLIADLDPLRLAPPSLHAELDPASYGLTIWDNDREFLTDDLHGPERMKFGDMLHVLRDAYCRTSGIEYMHISNPEQKSWIQARVEPPPEPFSDEERDHILERLVAAEAFERFLHARYVGHKRFGVDGAESVIPLLDAIFSRAANDEGTQAAVMGMAHRGRLNVLRNIVNKPMREMFREFEGEVAEDAVQGSGDVKYHLGQRATFEAPSGATLDITLAANPSHLEAVDPVVIGMTRARQDFIDPPGSFPVLPVLLHGDAAFAGQGVVAETLNMSDIPGYRVGGTIHVVINNQVGYTTLASESRSSHYATDVAKLIQAPIFHVNGDDPEACVRVARLAYDYRREFHADIVIDMVCYRRHGHNEGDDPSYTQPAMYKVIDKMQTVRERYTDALLYHGVMSPEQVKATAEAVETRLQEALDEIRAEKGEVTQAARSVSPPPPGRVQTGVDRSVLDRIQAAQTDYPDGFVPHPKLLRQLETRTKMYREGEVDWGYAEAMAWGSLLMEGNSIRVAGQDTRRGTFAHRHAVQVDNLTEDQYTPLANLSKDQGRFWIYDSNLSEFAALGFEFGYSIEKPHQMVVWEAQFGDFVNGAQVIIDQFIVASEDKWRQRSGLVMLLPHGYEGQGPEHSSARMERFLILCAENNLCVANVTTSAQYFHLLRRQVVGDLRRPLIVFSPKSLLRSRNARSDVSELEAGHFCEVLNDDTVQDPAEVMTVVLCSGKIAYEAIAARDERSAAAAVVRIEQLYPWPADQLRAIIGRYSNVEEVVWLQEEPANMGSLTFVAARVHEVLPSGMRFRTVSRDAAGSPAVGSNAVHFQEAAQIMEQLFG
jgi:multifunctional 2-oxoglutarate metabolism enzyme